MLVIVGRERARVVRRLRRQRLMMRQVTKLLWP
jgi:hypothetical protein